MSTQAYVLIENLPPGWTNEERLTAWATLRKTGRQQHPKPSHINHSRLSLDGKKILMEADFEDSELTRDYIVNVIAVALKVNPTAVDARIKVVVFPGNTWYERGDAARQYLAANSAAWEGTV